MYDNHRNHVPGTERLGPQDFGSDGATGYCIGRFYRQSGGNVAFVADGFMLWGDAQNALRQSVSPETALHKGLVRAEGYEEEYRPDQVDVALAFVRHCNKIQEPIVVHDHTVDGGSETQIFDPQEMHPRQEGAFAIACQVIGKYLARELEEDQGDDGDESEGDDDVDNGTAPE